MRYVHALGCSFVSSRLSSFRIKQQAAHLMNSKHRSLPLKTFWWSQVPQVAAWMEIVGDGSELLNSSWRELPLPDLRYAFWHNHSECKPTVLSSRICVLHLILINSFAVTHALDENALQLCLQVLFEGEQQHQRHVQPVMSWT